jgi:hypothetical protein
MTEAEQSGTRLSLGTRPTRPRERERVLPDFDRGRKWSAQERCEKKRKTRERGDKVLSPEKKKEGSRVERERERKKEGKERERKKY